MPAPIAVGIFSYKRNGITVSQAGLVGGQGKNFRMYAEFSGTLATIGTIQPGVAIANTTGQQATVTLDLGRLDGSSTGLTKTITLPANGQTAQFINEAFPTLSSPFNGILRVTSASTITMVGLRGRYNERGDFLITTVPPVDEASTSSTAEMDFPHIPDGGGYSTQYVLFGAAGQPLAGTLESSTSGGQPFVLQLQ